MTRSSTSPMSAFSTRLTTSARLDGLTVWEGMRFGDKPQLWGAECCGLVTNRMCGAPTVGTNDQGGLAVGASHPHGGSRAISLDWSVLHGGDGDDAPADAAYDVARALAQRPCSRGVGHLPSQVDQLLDPAHEVTRGEVAL